ncbi:DNA ligase [Pseudoalteromonas tunicata]|uniref:DNA ligase n=1 Tax=Pseudoalteromonas tunicata TaxID=314281 RepID=UPI00273EEC6C|nr:DNA ligase [Pseudoalteromonas tunicata]MDP4984416.1 DNA ligase [Pseudoalteromonas tunicata]
MSLKWIIGCLMLCIWLQPLQAADPMPVQLATVYQNTVVVSDYFASEKYDGIRAIWDGKQLTTRSGHVIAAPNWFTERLPALWLDGELWAGRNKFEQVSATVRDNTPDDQAWRAINYLIFDAPDQQQPFSWRVQHYQHIVQMINQPFIKAVEQHSFNDNQQLQLFLDSITKQGGEGVMLHRKTALFKDGRSDNLIKLKPYMDSEAQVVAHVAGKGKYLNMLGALLVRTPEGIEFKIGTGFSDADRLNPPAIGAQITYRYHGFTKNGVPRFASYLRVRNEP